MLIVDDQAAGNEFVKRVLRDHSVVAFTNPLEAEAYARRESFDIIIADQRMPEMTGLELINRIQLHQTDFVAMVLSAHTNADDLILAINRGTIFRYLVKPMGAEDLRAAVRDAGEELRLHRRRRNLELELVELKVELERSRRGCVDDSRDPFFHFVGEHRSVRRLIDLARSYAEVDEPVLITGETGTGKEVLARAMHAASPRREGPFVALNCSAFSEHLIESELFGHNKGAYTDARDAKRGLVETAAGGTLFLDEIGDFPLSLQPKILRFVQHGTFLPVGATQERRVELRIISATNRDLRRLVQDNSFREDLLYRINTLELEIPPVRSRAADIPLLLTRCAEYRGYTLPAIPPDVMDTITAYRFPGNVREIEALAARLSVHARLGTSAEALSQVVVAMTANGHTHPSGQTTSESPLDAAEVEVIRRTIREHDGNLTRSAAALGISRQGLRDKLKRFGLYGRD